jgi:hypothetical protein
VVVFLIAQEFPVARDGAPGHTELGHLK